MKGILLAGGSGTRLHPNTLVFSKQLLPVFDKPMIYYPLSMLMLAGIKEILLISTPQDIPFFKQLLQDGSELGISISYAVQEQPKGIAQALTIGESFINEDNVALILGDNVFFGHSCARLVNQAIQENPGATLFAHEVSDPQRYGVLELGPGSQILSLEEKPLEPKSNFAATGLYLYDNQAAYFAKQLRPSARGELEITDLNKIYIEQGLAKATILGRGIAWLDTGTHESLLQASQFVETLQNRQGIHIACLEEIAYRQGFIDKSQLEKAANKYQNSSYGQYIKKLIPKIEREYAWTAQN